MKNRTKRSHKLMAIFLMLVFMPSLLPVNYVLASNTGPNAAEAAGFEPVDATDMVNLGTGDLAYSLPLMDVDGFPVTLAYHAGITSTLDASWAGLGWYLNTGAVNRQQVAVPDDWYAGKAINFISYEDAETTYNIGVGFAAGPMEAGVGVSWGGSKGLQGSVEASASLTNLLPASSQEDFGLGVGGSASTNGSYYIGAYANARIGKSAGLSSSIGYSSGGWSAGANLGISQGSPSAFSSLGIGYDTSGNFSINQGAGGGNIAGSAGLSMGSFSAGDYDVSVSNQGFKISGQAIGIPVYIKFGRTKVTYSLRKGYLDVAYGSMYASEASNLSPSNNPDSNFNDYQDRYNYMDVYEQPLPQEEAEFITDFRPNEEKLNFNYAGYDNFEVQANGVNGRLRPRLLDNVTLFNRGFNAASSDVANRKNHVFYHSSGKSATREFGYQSNNQMQMYFEGAFSSKELIAPSSYDFVGNNLGALVNDPAPQESSFLSNPNNRATTPSFVEVYTNEELLQYGQTQGVMEPESLPFNQRNNADLVDPKGIGAYKITSPDGKTYHFTLPVYHFETVKRTLLKTANQNPYSPVDVSENRQYDKYATHWLLTAVTGPDFVDVNNDGKVGDGDYGYWVRLDYGKWSDGYTWKQPYEDDARLYTTNQLSEIDEEDFGYFSFGRKQLYYLNKIVSREHTALFIKDIRHDAVGKDFDYSFSNSNAGILENTINPTGNPGTLSQSHDVHVREIAVPYREEYTLRLDRIALVKNNVAQSIQTNLGSGLGSSLDGYQEDQSVNGTWTSPDFRDAYSSNYQYLLHQEDNVLDVNDFDASGIQSNVLREVRFQHSYDLAKNSVNSIVTTQNPYGGKLTLDKVHFRGKAGANYMPPYSFEYFDEEKENISLAGIRENLKNQYGENTTDYRREYTKIRKQSIDNWGYIQNDEDRWSLKSIKLPQGATINLTYEEDKYWTEAFSRRYWEENLMFAIYDTDNPCGTTGGTFHGPCYYDIYVKNLSGIIQNIEVDFSDYFNVGDKVYLDLWICKVEDRLIGGNDKRESFRVISNEKNVPSHLDIYRFEDRHVTDVTVKEILPNNTMVLTYGYNHNVDWYFFQQLEGGVNSPPVSTNLNNLTYYGKEDNIGSPRFRSSPTGTCINPSNQETIHTMTYKLLANKVPENDIGGGLRVSKIETVSSDGNIGVLEYDYNFPDGHEKAGRSSGITSFAPVDGLQFVPYQSELPSPGVQYEYVTLYRKNANNDILDYTRYNFHVLQQAFDIFDENIVLEDSDNSDNPEEDPIFWTEVLEGSSGSLQAKQIGVHVNSAIIGQYKNIEQFNQHDQLISKVSYDYVNGTALDQAGKGRIQESFNSLKSVFETNNDGNNPVLKDRLLSISTRTDYSNLLKKVTNNANGQTTWVEYGDVDPILGSFRESRTLRPDGSLKRDYRIPAYSVYTDMGPKALNPNNKNMLTQEAMTLSDVDLDANLTDNVHQWMTTSATVTTWRNSSLYNNEGTLTNDGIWRKHESYVWKDALDAQGTFGREINQGDFSWSGAQSNTEWQKISETTRYDHWSSPIELKDVNDNYIATKMRDDHTKVFASANASYSEMFYSGAEDLDGSNFGGDVGKGSATQNSTNAHTGNYSMQLTSGQNAFSVSVVEGKTDRYKASLWVKFGGENAAKLRVAGSTVEPNTAETVRAGDWMQLNFYFTISGTQTAEVISSGSTIYVDDFRLHPVTAAMNTFVYNQWDELTHVIGPNNLATQYEYDSGGRLTNTYSEVIDFNGDGTGGFKQISNYGYNYRDTGSN